MRVLITLDGSPLAEAALRVVNRWPLAPDSEIRILSLIDADAAGKRERSGGAEFYSQPGASGGRIPPMQSSQFGPVIAPTGDPPPRVVETRGEALGRAKNEREDYVRHLVHEKLQGRANVQMLVDYSDEPAEDIVRIAGELDVDCVVMATHGRSGLNRMVAGSVAERVVREAPVPVVLVGPETQERL